MSNKYYLSNAAPICMEIRTILNNNIDIEALEVVNETKLHVTHDSFVPGKYHIRLIIKSQELNDIAPVSAHRLIYKALDELIKTKIHALAIELKK